MYSEVVPPNGVACITHGNDAVREFSSRMRRLGLRQGHRLFVGTVHSFCLNRILRPFAVIAVGRSWLARGYSLQLSREGHPGFARCRRCG
jgi:superfamily I DNA/RNA helicase